jgi:hypothetical protein
MSRPKLFHLFRNCPEHTWIDGLQAIRFDWSEDGERVVVEDYDNNDWPFEDQEVDLSEGHGTAHCSDGYDASVYFEVPVPIRVTNENWEEYLPLKGPQ